MAATAAPLGVSAAFIPAKKASRSASAFRLPKASLPRMGPMGWNFRGVLKVPSGRISSCR
jgi:hypothetical protein